MFPDFAKYQLWPPKVVAIATDKYLTPTTPFPDPVNLPGVPAPKYGQDITFGYNRRAPKRQSVGQTVAELKPKMRELLTSFASADKSGMAQRLFNAFLADQCRRVIFFEDPSLNLAASNHQNIQDFCSMALSAPNSRLKTPGKTRIHQALKKANWDINKITIPSDLGVPAFNTGSYILGTGDYDNGLGLMVNGIQHAYAVATAYYHDKNSSNYYISLRFIFFDVFGLDDDDLDEYGSTSTGLTSSDEGIGITAWWQLQHQHGYAPLVTRIVIERSYEVPTK